MRKADFEARIRKIEIVNRALTDRFVQTLRVVLDEVELSNENLLEVRQFRPNEVVHVEITPAQLSLGDLAAGGGGGPGGGARGLSPAAAPGELAGLVEEEEEGEAVTRQVPGILARW